MNKLLISIAKIPIYQPRFSFNKVLKDKDKGDEKQFFSKEDQKLMSKLIKKMKEANEHPQASTSNSQEDKDELQKIFSRYKVNYTDAMIEEILNWKKSD
ncbi:unnamed protein product [Paramecium pentaurelia]|uniref:Uncharacterized protein n=1 Tax=Paramecium pentaurelia TaxID=43138 RepID=A0A8S1UK24_9CILI|nr:unnamed protein product [Paramecium pentaurelia]